jgi:transcriptional regulator with XRE-family HTH domain
MVETLSFRPTGKTRPQGEIPLHAEVGQKIRELRLKKGMLQEELARKAGLSPSALSNFEQGRRRTSLDWLRKIGKALGVTVSDLIPESRTRKPLAENKEEEKLLGHWRKIGNIDLQDQLLEVVELSASGGRRNRA